MVINGKVTKKLIFLKIYKKLTVDKLDGNLDRSNYVVGHE